MPASAGADENFAVVLDVADRDAVDGAAAPAGNRDDQQPAAQQEMQRRTQYGPHDSIQRLLVTRRGGRVRDGTRHGCSPQAARIYAIRLTIKISNRQARSMLAPWPARRGRFASSTTSGTCCVAPMYGLNRR